MFTIVMISEGAALLATSVGLTIVNALLMIRLRQHHPDLYESIGSPGWVWTRQAYRNNEMYFVFGSQWVGGADPALANLCRLSRALYIAHFSLAIIILFTLIGFPFTWIA